jgi:DNA-binding NtrC family response regulator
MSFDGLSGDRTGRRVLIVEDEVLVSLLLEDMLGDLGHEAVGPAGNMETALRLANEASVDMAILDVNLNGEESYPVADALAARGIPFVLATGYGADGVREGYRHVPRLQKPFRLTDLALVVAQALSARA